MVNQVYLPALFRVHEVTASHSVCVCPVPGGFRLYEMGLFRLLTGRYVEGRWDDAPVVVQVIRFEDGRVVRGMGFKPGMAGFDAWVRQVADGLVVSHG